MRLTESKAGLMIVEDRVGYAFVFKIDQADEADIDLVDEHWEGAGPAPEMATHEHEARRFIRQATGRKADRTALVVDC